MIELPPGPHDRPPPDVEQALRSTTVPAWPVALDKLGVVVWFRPNPPAHVCIDGVWTAPALREGCYWFPGWVWELKAAFEDVIDTEASFELLTPVVRAFVADPSLVDAMRGAERLGGSQAVFDWSAQFYEGGTVPRPDQLDYDTWPDKEDGDGEEG